MPVSGKELASLDFGNLIGGPLNAVVEAQAKSAITTANFIKEVGFDKTGKVINSTFSYEKTNSQGRVQEFKLTVPFLCLLPIPYIKVDEAIVEFNAKITSTTESKTDSNFQTEVNASAGGSWWFASAKLSTKTSYQKKSSTSDKEERTFDMHVKVTASNTDMPAGTEKILNMLEESMQENPGKIQPILFEINTTAVNTTNHVYSVTSGSISAVIKDMKVKKQDADGAPTGSELATINSIDYDNKTITFSAGVTESKLVVE